MKPFSPILGPAGRAALRRALARPALVAFDYDGTLAPIVAHPSMAQLPEPVAAGLRRLAALAPLAIVSGRSIDDLRARADVGVQDLVGNHGNETADGAAAGDEAVGDETVGGRAAASAHARSICRAWANALAAMLRESLDDPGILIEDKGLTLSLHYREARDPERAGALLHALVQRLEPAPCVIGGTRVVNLLPPGSVTKFEALCALAARHEARSVVYTGDDDTDEIVFERAPSGWLTVRVEPRGPSAARFVLARQAEVTGLIDAMIALLQARSA
ncbi:MAG: trehalose-phosphatase [Burkholderiales bacterium]|nr:trehalose-phosphatase [Burkholderiales bacterium]OJX02472.1 MAG: trehalose-phosphatase [Burkholderiales bacterium 70-64]